MADTRLDPEAIAGRIADGKPVDWDEALQRASDERERGVIRQLRLVAGVAEAHRSVES